MGAFWLSCFGFLIAIWTRAAFSGSEVTYDGRSLIIDGQRKLLFSGSIHYPRSTPDMWPSLISKAKHGGLDVIETYVFWNLHEPHPGQYDFSGRRNILRFIKEIQAQGLYACIRIGPYIESEWTYGGLPFWLHDVPGIVYRSDNEPFKFYMQNFTAKIVNMFKSEGLYAPQGGPIILQQIENEYQNVERHFGEKGPPYVRWAAAMAVGLQTGVPWVMCKQDDAPDPVINTCNGRMCGETFKGPNSPNKPAIWTENWTSFYQVYGVKTPLRSAEDLAYNAALFIAKKKGSFINYYMYHGGTNFGRTGSSFIITSYYDQAPLDEYGLIRQPKWGHLKELHAVIKSFSQTLLSGVPTNSSLGRHQEAYVFRRESGECAAFLVNYDRRTSSLVQFQNSLYELPPTSVSILPDCRTEAFNTAKLGTQHGKRSTVPAMKFDSVDRWSEFKEVVPVFEETSIRSNSLLEHMSTTKDKSDYLWYITRSYMLKYRILAYMDREPLQLLFVFPAVFTVVIDSSEAQMLLTVDSLGHALHAFVNGEPAGSAHGSYKNQAFTLERLVNLQEGMNNISLLSLTVGLPDSGAHLELREAGLDRVRIQKEQETNDLTNSPWGYQIGFLGERLQLYTLEGSRAAKWSKLSASPQQLTWYKTFFDAPEGDDPVAINLGSMGKGEVWINGQSIGRYWVSFLTACGSPSQTWYHIPRSFLKPTRNHLVLFEEESGDPLQISIDTISINEICEYVSDSGKKLNKSSRKYEKHHGGKHRVQLRCPPKRRISKILFASFGNPVGDCESYSLGSCHSSNSTAVVEAACIRKRQCSIVRSNKIFGGDPCPGIPKTLLVDAQCT